MLTYTFSTREKVLLALLAFVGIIIAWYYFVFSNIQGRVAQIDSEIASVQESYMVNQTRATERTQMEKTIEEYKAKGYEAILLPKYDNTQNLMAYLNGVLASAQDYSFAFDVAALSEEDSTIHRAGTITFDTNSYEEARSIVQAIARGPYTCEVDGLSVVDNKTTSKSASASSGAAYTSTLTVTFFERPSSKQPTATTEEKTQVEGQDLSKLTNLS